MTIPAFYNVIAPASNRNISNQIFKNAKKKSADVFESHKLFYQDDLK
jgi:hypothetical protein